MSDTPFIERTLAGLGIDRAVGWTVAARVWSMLAGPVSVILIAAHLSAEEQGFYYTFASIVAFQVMFELGLGMVIVQFASHEKAFLEWRPDGTLGGSEVEKGRLAALLRKTLQWYAVATTLAIVVLIIGGTFFFADQSTTVQPTTVEGWSWPWIALAILAGGTLFLTPFLSLLEGCGLIIEVARVRTWQVIASNLAGWSVLLVGGALWTSPAIMGASLLVGSAWILWTHRRLFSDLLRTHGGGISWRAEVWPFQWRIAVSWISSYFTFHLFIPVLFNLRGPAVAGKMGMSLTLASAVFVVATSLLTTKIPRFGELIARRDFTQLDAQFFPAMGRSLGVMALGATALLGGTFLLRGIGHRWSERLLEPLPFALLLATMLINTLFFAEAVYLRAHKQEPLLGIFIASGIAVATCAVTLGRNYGATGMMLGYFLTTLVISLGGGTWVFVRKRRAWHGKREAT
jgi:O-antigen/teichoic acid export membrane protein